MKLLHWLLQEEACLARSEDLIGWCPRYSTAFQSNRGLHLNGNQFTSEVPECLNATFFWDWDDEVCPRHSSPSAHIPCARCMENDSCFAFCVFGVWVWACLGLGFGQVFLQGNPGLTIANPPSYGLQQLRARCQLHLPRTTGTCIAKRTPGTQLLS